MLCQRKASIELRQYHASIGADVDRLSALLMLLPSIRSLQPQVNSILFGILSLFVIIQHSQAECL